MGSAERDRRSSWGRGAFTEAAASTTTVSRPPRSRSPLQEESADLVAGAAETDPSELELGWFGEVAVVLVDAVLARDKQALNDLEAGLREVHRRTAAAGRRAAGSSGDSLRRTGDRLDVTMEFVRSALDRIEPVAIAAEVAGTHRERFLRVVAENPGVNSRGLAEALGEHVPMDEGQLSKLGKRLRTDGLLFAARTAAGLSWELTPRGAVVVETLAARSDDGTAGTVAVRAEETSAAAVAAALAERVPQTLEVTVTWERGSAAADDGVEPERADVVEQVGEALAPPPIRVASNVAYRRVPVKV